MGFPKRLLADHEKLVLDLRPHWVALAGPVALTVLVVVAQILALRHIPDTWPTWTRWGVFVVLLALFVFVAVREFLSWLTSHFVVTSDRLIHRSGWLAKRSMEMPLERINDVSFNQTVFERMVGAGDLIIESAGEYGQNTFADIRKPEQVQKTIYELSEANEKRMTDDVDTPVEELERLAALRGQGAISEQEYEAAKKRLLDRM